MAWYSKIYEKQKKNFFLLKNVEVYSQRKIYHLSVPITCEEIHSEQSKNSEISNGVIWVFSKFFVIFMLTAFDVKDGLCESGEALFHKSCALSSTFYLLLLFNVKGYSKRSNAQCFLFSSMKRRAKNVTKWKRDPDTTNWSHESLCRPRMAWPLKKVCGKFLYEPQTQSEARNFVRDIPSLQPNTMHRGRSVNQTL